MSGKNINFEDKKIKQVIYTKTEQVFKIDDTDINKILVSKKTIWCK